MIRVTGYGVVAILLAVVLVPVIEKVASATVPTFSRQPRRAARLVYRIDFKSFRQPNRLKSFKPISYLTNQLIK
jgi:hypothetical protein